MFPRISVFLFKGFAPAEEKPISIRMAGGLLFLKAPAQEKLTQAIAEATKKIAAHGPFNYLLSDGESFFAHCATKLAYIVREAPFSAAHLIDEDISVDFKEVTSGSDRVAIIATTPLTDNEHWTLMAPGELLAFQNGKPVKS